MKNPIVALEGRLCYWTICGRWPFLALRAQMTLHLWFPKQFPDAPVNRISNPDDDY